MKYNISDVQKSLRCSRNTVYALIKELDTKTVQAGNARLMTDEDYQRLRSYYFDKYPNRTLIRPTKKSTVQNHNFNATEWVQDLRSERDYYTDLLKIVLEQNSQLIKLLLEKK